MPFPCLFWMDVPITATPPNCLYEATNTSQGSTITLTNVDFLTAQTYYIVVSSKGGQGFLDWYEFDLTVELTPGNICSNSEEVLQLPYYFSGSTEFMGNDYNTVGSCSSQHISGNDMVFSYAAQGGEIAQIILEKTGSYSNSNAISVFVLDGCPDSATPPNCLYEATSSSDPTIYIETVEFEYAQTYFIVVSSKGGQGFLDWYEFDLSIELPTGNICANAIDANQISFPYMGTTQYLGNDYGSGDACASQYMTGNDVVFSYTSPGNEIIRVMLEKISPTVGSSAISLFVLDRCPDDPNTPTCMYEAISIQGATTIAIETIELQMAQTYYIVVSSKGGQGFLDWYDFELTIDHPTGNTCANAEEILALDYVHTGSTQWYGDDYDHLNACNSNYMKGNDFVYEFTPSHDTDIEIVLDVPTSHHTAIHFLDDCPDIATSCTTLEIPATGPVIDTLHNQPVIAGHTYYIVVSSWDLNHPGYFDYTLYVNDLNPPAPAPMVAGTSQANQEQDYHFNVYPNPSFGDIRIDTPAGLPEGNLQVYLTDLSGKQIQAGEISSHPATGQHISLPNHLPGGVYVLKIAQAGQMLAYERVVLVR